MHDSPSQPTPTGISGTLRRNLLRVLARGDLQQAALILERLKEEDPLSLETRGLELDYLLRGGRLPEARVLAEQLVRLFPGSPRIQFLAGQVAYRLRQWTEAAECFGESHRLYPSWRTNWWLAKALTQSGVLEQAATMLEALVVEHPYCGRDLAWSYERKEEYQRALAAIETYLEFYPEDELARTQRVRLRARLMDEEELIEETEGMLEFGEDVSDLVVPQYLDALFRTGRRSEVQQFLAQRAAGFETRLATSSAWVCYHNQAYDLAFDLFVSAFASNCGNVKFLAALDCAAKRSGRVAQLIQLYEDEAQHDPRLYGRLKQLRRASGRQP